MEQSLCLAKLNTPPRLGHENIGYEGLKKEKNGKSRSKRRHMLPPSSQKSRP